jgi:hypothetical protein
MASIIQSLCLGIFILAGQQVATKPSDPGRVMLAPDGARLFGERMELNREKSLILGLSRPAERVEWDFEIKNGQKPGFDARIGDQNRLGPIHPTGDESKFLPQVLFDPVELPGGRHRLALGLTKQTELKGLAVQKVELVRAAQPGIP